MFVFLEETGWVSSFFLAYFRYIPHKCELQQITTVKNSLQQLKTDSNSLYVSHTDRTIAIFQHIFKILFTCNYNYKLIIKNVLANNILISIINHITISYYPRL
jgi:hypothetical protein